MATKSIINNIVTTEPSAAGMYGEDSCKEILSTFISPLNYRCCQ